MICIVTVDPTKALELERHSAEHGAQGYETRVNIRQFPQQRKLGESPMRCETVSVAELRKRVGERANGPQRAIS